MDAILAHIYGNTNKIIMLEEGGMQCGNCAQPSSFKPRWRATVG
jgi:hypothetical protein